MPFDSATRTCALHRQRPTTVSRRKVFARVQALDLQIRTSQSSPSSDEHIKTTKENKVKTISEVLKAKRELENNIYFAIKRETEKFALDNFVSVGSVTVNFRRTHYVGAPAQTQLEYVTAEIDLDSAVKENEFLK
jgi:hypothetical protein